jgi:hypothetical protein
MPHCNLLYPIRPLAEFPAVIPALAATCALIEPFGVTFGEFRLFWHGSGRCTLWLAPEPAGELRSLQAALRSDLPDCDDLSGFPAGFTPHLSVGQFPSLRDGERVREQLQATWGPVTFLLADVAVLVRGAAPPFVVHLRIALRTGGGGR